MKLTKHHFGLFGLLAAFALLVAACDSEPVVETYPRIDNPLVADFNAAIDFAAVTPADIDSAAAYIKAKTDFEIKNAY